jgi:hypothetical protein
MIALCVLIHFEIELSTMSEHLTREDMEENGRP